MDEEEEPLPPHVIAGIKQEMADFEAGRFITKEEFYKKTGLDKLSEV